MKKMNIPDTAVVVPHRELSPETLLGVIEQFISRDGQDSGHVDISFEQKSNQVLRHLDDGKAVLVFDQKTNTCNIVVTDDMGR